MSRISETWGTKDWQYSFDMKSTKTLNDIYSVDKTLEFNTAIDNTAFFIKATDNNILNGVYEIKPPEGAEGVWTNFEITNHNTDTFLGFGCVYSRGINSNRLDTIKCFDINSNAKQPWIKNSKNPVNSNNWINQHSFQTNQQCIMKTYDYTKIYCTASLLVTRTDYNPGTGKYDKVIAESKTIKECLSITDKTNRYIVGIIYGQPGHTDGTMSSPSMPMFIANTTIPDLDIQLQTPLGNVVSSTDVGLVLDTQPNQYGGLVPLNPDLIDFEHGYIGNSHYLPFKVAVDDKDGMCRLLASLGYIIHCDVDNRHNLIYPLIANGMCDGSYTLNEDEFKESENGKWTDTDIIPSPTPSPKEPEDHVDDMRYNLYGSVGGNIRYYRITQQQLANLGQAIQSEDFVNPLQNIVCLNQYPFAVDPHIFNTYSDEDITIQGKSTGATGRPITNYIQYWGVESIDVPTIHNNFLDNSPYTQYELYIPFCGWVTLPDFVHGHTITVSLLNDLISTSVRGIVHCNLNGNNIVVAEKQGSFGTSCPLSASDEGTKQNALTGAMLNTVSGIMSTGFALTTGNAIGTVSGIASTLGAITQGNIANNNNYVSSIGTSNDRTMFANYDKIYLKINTVYSCEPKNYAHTVGRPSNASGTVNDFTGYTVFSNVDVSGLTCSDTEKQKIKSLLETGVYC